MSSTTYGKSRWSSGDGAGAGQYPKPRFLMQALTSVPSARSTSVSSAGERSRPPRQAVRALS
ncbi:hypothetical protein [Streptomyces sp. NBC_01304]|uniref:hypothetical protein n=1 Tax=Streptomyces sp. NBC_01304 TaxID=2903818 RepID=UPI002E0EDD9B|nr:hypothetical protein OG430_20310 [Streptomyces sp. NBC_01304]